MIYGTTKVQTISLPRQYRGNTFLAHLLRFDNKTTQTEQWNLDRLAYIRDIFEEINKRNASMRYPSPFLTVDETLYPYRGHIEIKQYNPSKPAYMDFCIVVYVMQLFRMLTSLTITLENHRK